MDKEHAMSSRFVGPRIRWFLAEFFVVLAGILVALLLQAWWQYRSDRQTEQVYLRQISADLQQTIISMVKADSTLRPAERAGSLVIQAYQSKARPEPDSVFKWLRELRLTTVRRPMLGTVQALLTTGDLKLIRNDTLRTAIVQYNDRALATIASTEDVIRVSSEAYASLNQLVDYPELMLETNRIMGTDEFITRAFRGSPLGEEFRFIAPGVRRSRFKRSAEELLSDRRVAGLLVTIQISKRNQAGERRTHTNLALDLRKQIERELGHDTLAVLRDSVRR